MSEFVFASMPSGPISDSAISNKVYAAAIAECVFFDHCMMESFGTGKGQSLSLPRISNITEPTDSSLSEYDDIPEDTFSVSSIKITVQEFGRGIGSTQLARDLSVFDLKNAIQRKLKDQMRLAIDTRACRAFKLAKYTYVPTGAASATTSTNGTAGTAATSNMNTYHLEQIADILYDTLLAPPVMGDNYVGIFRTLSYRGIERDPSWEQFHTLSNPEAKYRGEVGTWDRVRVIETNHGGSSVTAGGLNVVGTSSVLGEGLVFGEDGVVMVEAVQPSLRADIPRNYGRFQAVAW